jgi:hypothetical protein
LVEAARDTLEARVWGAVSCASAEPQIAESGATLDGAGRVQIAGSASALVLAKWQVFCASGRRIVMRSSTTVTGVIHQL